MKKLKQASREQLNGEYYQAAATVGDIDRQIRDLEMQKANLLSSMSVTLKHIRAMPLSKEAQAEIEEKAAAQEQQEAEQPAEAAEGQ